MSLLLASEICVRKTLKVLSKAVDREDGAVLNRLRCDRG